MSDLISRQAAIDAIDSLYFDTVDDHDRAKERIKRLPSAQPERQIELVGTESNIEILSELRAQFNCFDEVEEPCYRALSDAICALSAQPEVRTQMSPADCISRQAAIDAIRAMQTYKLFAGDDSILVDQAGAQKELMMLPSAQQKQEWTPCSKRLPEKEFKEQRRGTYLVTNNFGIVFAASYFFDDGDDCCIKAGWHSNSEIVAWAPMPGPWKGEDNERV